VVLAGCAPGAVLRVGKSRRVAKPIWVMSLRVAHLIVPVLTPLFLAGACTTAPGPSSPPRVAATGEAKHEAPSPPAKPADPPAAPEATTATPPTGGAVVDEKGCVVDVLAHAARIIVEQHGKEVSEQLGRPVQLADFTKLGNDVHSLPDLDGDGAEETEVTEDCCWGVYASLHVLYLSSHGCLRFAGELVDSELSALDTAHAGVRDLEATWSNGCAGQDFAWTRYRWNGKTYGVADKATCWFCTDRSVSVPPPGANRHPYCKQYARQMGKEPRSLGP
jgi:hypothetical protein